MGPRVSASLHADKHLQVYEHRTRTDFHPTLGGTITLKRSHWGLCDLSLPPAQGRPSERIPRFGATLKPALQLPVVLGERDSVCVDKGNLCTT